MRHEGGCEVVTFDWKGLIFDKYTPIGAADILEAILYLPSTNGERPSIPSHWRGKVIVYALRCPKAQGTLWKNDIPDRLRELDEGRVAARLQGHEALGGVAARRRDLQVLGRRRPAEREGETASRHRQFWGGLVSRGRCTSALREPSLWRGITVPAYGLQRHLIVHGPTLCQGIAVPEETNLRIKRSSL